MAVGADLTSDPFTRLFLLLGAFFNREFYSILHDHIVHAMLCDATEKTNDDLRAMPAKCSSKGIIERERERDMVIG